MNITEGYLSLWEIAHRLHDCDPNLSDPLALPLPVQDSLRLLTRELSLDNLHVVSEFGTTYWNFNDIPSREDFMPPSRMFSSTTEEDEDIKLINDVLISELSEDESVENEVNYDDINVEEEYQIFMDVHLRRHNQAVEDLDKCYKKRIFDKEKLESIFLDRYEFSQYCIRNNHKLPTFWFSENDIESFQTDNKKIELKETKLRPNQLDKELCRAIAQTLWSISPETNIATICRSKQIQMYGNGAQYTEKTMRSWIADLDPREGNTHGRPKKEE